MSSNAVDLAVYEKIFFFFLVRSAKQQMPTDNGPLSTQEIWANAHETGESLYSSSCSVV